MFRRSCVTNLSWTTQIIVDSALQKAFQIDVIYTVLSKAFDNIDYSITERKLLSSNITMNLVPLSSDYLTDREHKFRNHGHHFEPIFTDENIIKCEYKIFHTVVERVLKIRDHGMIFDSRSPFI